ncbi:MAG TPA: 2-oxo-4-hydroxy-4-carboxy-5-ureidoimidazoline decarboxylase [Candidatus Limnocylindria bacterium]|nr:2-oxo-4-hydroxy-4-carboxy-5-ureidoimidazoline decarboxylase [Candidatus Limnocylindria bacterium]
MLEERRIAEAFERAPALVDALLRAGPYATVDGVMTQARAVVDGMSAADRIALLDAHPRLGAAQGTLSAASAREQGAAADAGTTRELARLNDEYERRFGFRCVIFVAGRPKDALVPLMRERLGRDRAAELRTGVEEFLAIARDRLER